MKKKPKKDKGDWLTETHIGGVSELGPISDAIAELATEKRGSTVHAVGCPCGFCKIGYTKA